MHSEDSIMCCMFPYKCNLYPPMPVQAFVKTVMWYFSTAIVTCCLVVGIVWLVLRMVHRYTTNEIVCKYVCAENHVDTVTANKNGKPSSLFRRDEKTVSDDLANNDVTQSVENDNSNEMYSTRVTDTDESMVASTESEHKEGYADYKINPYSLEQDLDDDLGMPYLSVFKQSEVDYQGYSTFGDSNRSSEERITQNSSNDEKQCCVVDLSKSVSRSSEEQCCNNNHDTRLCPLVNDTIIPTVFAKDLRRIITYKSPKSLKCYLKTPLDKQQ